MSVTLPEGPYLAIEWRRDEDESGVWYADYYLSLPVDRYDIRNDGSGRVRAEFGKTKVTSAREAPLDGRGNVDTPYRDGCHIVWDAARLNLPAFAIYEDRVTALRGAAATPDTTPSR